MKKIFSLLFILGITSNAVLANNFTLKVNEETTGNSAITAQQQKKSYSNGFSQGFSDFYETKNVSGGRTEITDIQTVSRDLPYRISSIDTNDSTVAHVSHDPYILQINGTKYMLIKENNDKKFDKNDILGITDTKETVFNSLRPLDINKDNKLTGEELTKAGIRLVKIAPDGKLINDNKQDFKNSKIVYIYMKELRKAYKNDGTTGDFGMYDVLIKNDTGKTNLVTGFVTFETPDELAKYF